MHTVANLLKRRSYADNDLTALSPEFWVAEGLRVLRQSLVVAPLFGTDYKDVVARAGQVIHVHKRGEVYAKRKLPGVDVQAQVLRSYGQLIRLNQQPYVHYTVEDIEEAVSMGDVVQDFIEPGFFAEGRYIDVVCAMQSYDFFRNQAGGDLVDSVRYKDLVDANRIMNILKVPRGERGMVINSMAESGLLNEEKLTTVQNVGSGAPLMNGVIGGGAGFAVIPSLSMPMTGDYANAITAKGAINHSGGYGRGSTAIAVDGFDATLTVGSFITIETGSSGSGRVSVHQITGQAAEYGATIGIAIVPGIVSPVLDNAVVTVYKPGTVAHPTTGAYADQHADLVRIECLDGQIPEVLQGISFEADGPVYGILSVYPVENSDTKFDLELHRPLDTPVSHGAGAFFFPPVGINWSFTKDASTLVSRPLRIPRGAAAAAMGSIINIALRVVIGYDMKAQEELVTIDTLFGVKTLDRDKGMLLIG